MKRGSFILMLALVDLFALRATSAQAAADTEDTPVAKAASGPKVSLEAGISASEGLGKPVSARLEKISDGFQLSVRTFKDGGFMLVFIDPVTGQVTSVDPIADSKDLVTLKAESKAMGMAKVSLAAAVRKAVTANKGFRAMDVSPAIVDGHPIAEVTLVRGKGSKKVTEGLE